MYRVLCVSETGHTYNVYKAAPTREKARELVQAGCPAGCRVTATIDLM